MSGRDRWTHRWEEPWRLSELVVPDLFTSHALLPHDLFAQRRTEPPARIARRLYERLSGLDLAYDVEPYSAQVHEQTVRQPYEVLTGQRTANCLDISLLFTGICVAAHLRPLLVLFERPGGTRHAQVLLTPCWSSESENVVWADLPADHGLLTLEPPQLAQAIRDQGWQPIEVTGALSSPIWTDGKLTFADATAKALELLTQAPSIRLLDIVHLHRRRGFRPRPAFALPEHLAVPQPGRAAAPQRDPAHEFGAEVRTRYGPVAGLAPDARWDAAALRSRTGEGRDADLLTALRDALPALPVLTEIGAAVPRRDQLRKIFRDATHRVAPDGSSREVMLVEAALVRVAELRRARRAPLCALARFVLGLARERGVRPGSLPRELDSWLCDVLGHQREDVAEFLARPEPEQVWAILELNAADNRDDWPSWVTLHVVTSADVLGRPYGERCPTLDRQGLQSALRAVLRHLPTVHGLYVDILAPSQLLGAGIERWPLIEAEGELISLSQARCRPRLRWSGRYASHWLQQNHRHRCEQGRWEDPPLTVPQNLVQEQLESWLEANETTPFYVSARHPLHDRLRTLLRNGCGFLVWFPSDASADELDAITRNGAKATATDRRHHLPDDLAKFTGPRGSLIWDDPDGREGLPLPASITAGRHT